VSVAGAGAQVGRRHGRHQYGRRFLGIERGAAFPAKIGGGPKLDKMTAVAANNLS